MLAKKYRLSEREVKKVLHKGKPFFSYNIVFNVFPSRLPHARFAIVISGKSVANNVIRNMYRRLFYDVSAKYIHQNFWDVVCVVKTKSKLGRSPEDVKAISKEITYLFEKKLWKNT